MASAIAKTKTKVKINTNMERPKLYSVVYFNDNKTPASYVMETLVGFFNMSPMAAIGLTDEIDKNGSGVAVSGLTKEIATHLVMLVMADAQIHNYPLLVEIKIEN